MSWIPDPEPESLNVSTNASHKADIILFRPRIELTGKEFNAYQAWTLVHEYGHVVLDRVVPKAVLYDWKDFHLERRKNARGALGQPTRSNQHA